MRSRLFLLLAVFLLCSACRTPLPAENTMEIWYAAAAGEDSREAILPLSREIASTEDVLAALFSPPENALYRLPYPAGVSVHSWNLGEDGVLYLDLSEEYGALAGVDLTLADACIVLTLTQLPGVSAVSITVAGAPVPFRALQTLTPSDLLLPGEKWP